ncbi:acyl-CoA N-acyltransferase [Conidiobolus coronatus NRRL 28638]|uniref:Acyl-CoA N-acyltransferase n=1 Tax=Conidiobolus coronatus (strain ATCC 28846 / CBS 209.66 / NRRL 28638) TaxID=796925 RepID=A0A137P0I0_CONC2|nr:acyl-CoA N-acyltransferase [Conidiobolus coronatus NRRL 28638]|eukprot:KXN68583.1 acyl-CoA N-acyltransferase [Conidiobolus coronatus NRRL 28638]
MNSEITVKECQTVEELLSNLELLKQLIPELTEESVRASFANQTLKRDYKVFFAVFRNKVVGLISFKSEQMLLCIDQKWAIVDEIVVDKDCRNQGIGKILLDYLCKHLKENDYKHILVLSGDDVKQAHNFYAKYGMQKIGVFFKHDL